MGIALERARLYDALQVQRIQEQATLLDLSQQLLSRRDLDDLMAFIVSEVRALLKADAVAVLLHGNNPDTLIFRAAAGCSGGNAFPLEICKFGDAITGKRDNMQRLLIET